MPRFLLHIVDDSETRDEEGTVYADLWAAREAAIQGARDMVCEQIQNGYLDLKGYIQIASESGQPLMRVGFGEVFEITK